MCNLLRAGDFGGRSKDVDILDQRAWSTGGRKYSGRSKDVDILDQRAWSTGGRKYNGSIW